MLTMQPTPPAETSPYRSIWTITWPQMLMMICQFLIGFADVWTAGRISPQAQASMGMVNQLMFFFLVVAMATANGGVAAISQSFGAGKLLRVRRYSGLVLVMALVMGLVFMGISQALRGPLLHLLRVPQELLPIADGIAWVFLLLLPINYLFVVSNAVFRAQKLVMLPLASTALVTLVNGLGNLGLGLGWFGLPNYGYMGLAWATFASVSAGLVLNLLALGRLGILSSRSIPPWRWVRLAFPYLFKVAWPGGLMQLLWHSAALALFAITASLPTGSMEAMGGLTAGIRLESALFLPGFALNLSASILVGEQLGRGRPDLARQLGLRILGMGVVVFSLLAGVAWFAVPDVAAFVAPDPGIRQATADYLYYNLAAMPFTMTTMIMGGVFVGAGATVYNLLTFGFAGWAVRVPLAMLLGWRILGNAQGVWMAMFLSQAFQGTVSLYIFLRKDWPRFAMRRAPNHVSNP